MHFESTQLENHAKAITGKLLSARIEFEMFPGALAMASGGYPFVAKNKQLACKRRLYSVH